MLQQSCSQLCEARHTFTSGELLLMRVNPHLALAYRYEAAARD